MISMLVRIRGNKVPDPINNPVANATTPDRMIVAGIIQSLRTDFKHWEARSLGSTWTDHSYDAPTRTLINVRKGITVKWDNQNRKKGNYGGKQYKLDSRKATVNGLPLDEYSSRLLIQAYDKICAAEETAQAVARKALLAMQQNEQKWELAEKLLNMKRTPLGALVPIKTVGHET